MSGFNTTSELAKVETYIQGFQMDIAGLENDMDRIVLAGTTSSDGRDLESEAAVRTKIELVKAALGKETSHRSYLVQQLEEDKQARKNQGELTKG
jgi:hypothetical protein